MLSVFISTNLKIIEIIYSVFDTDTTYIGLTVFNCVTSDTVKPSPFMVCVTVAVECFP